MIKVEFFVYNMEEYDSAMELVRACPGWLEMTVWDLEPFDDDEPIANVTAYFDTESHAMLFRLKAGV